MAYGAGAVSDEHGEDHAGRGRHLAGDHGKAEAEAKAEAVAVMAVRRAVGRTWVGPGEVRNSKVFSVARGTESCK